MLTPAGAPPRSRAGVSSRQHPLRAGAGQAQAAGRPGVAASFSDSGIGIPKENLPKLFEPLFTTKITGIGLGPAAANTIIKSLDGTIRVESQEGKDSTFAVWLPL